MRDTKHKCSSFGVGIDNLLLKVDTHYPSVSLEYGEWRQGEMDFLR